MQNTTKIQKNNLKSVNRQQKDKKSWQQKLKENKANHIEKTI